MSVRVLFFGSLADKLGQRERAVPVKEHMTLADVVDAVGCVDFKPLMLALNQQQVTDMDVSVVDGDEVAIMPPFSGG